MKIMVAIKSVVDVELKLSIDNGQLKQEGLNHVMSKWDENALEAALQIKEANEGEVTVVTVGPDYAQDVLRKALAMGADKAIHVNDAATAGSDALGIARILSAVAQFGAAAQGEAFSLVLTGRQSQDNDMGAVSAYLAHQLGVPWTGNIAQITPDCSSGKLSVQRKGDSGTEVINLPMPCLITANDSLNEPRLASLRGIMQAKQKPLETLALDALGLDAQQVGEVAAGYEVMEWMVPPTRAAGRAFTGDAIEVADEVVGLLANEAKIFS